MIIRETYSYLFGSVGDRSRDKSMPGFSKPLGSLSRSTSPSWRSNAKARPGLKLFRQASSPCCFARWTEPDTLALRGSSERARSIAKSPCGFQPSLSILRSWSRLLVRLEPSPRPLADKPFDLARGSNARFARKGVALAILVLGCAVFVVWHYVQAEADTIIRRSECAVALGNVDSRTVQIPSQCSSLSTAELNTARTAAPCLAARQRAVRAGLDPDKACQLTVQATDSPR